MTAAPLRAAAPLWLARLEDADRHLPPLIDRFETLCEDPVTRHSHWFEGRFENIYIDRERLPELAPVGARVLACARAVLGREDLKYGFWFNRMGPGHRTTLHDHQENDELLSAVLYLTAPRGSGDLVLRDAPVSVRITPEAGLLVLFPPNMPHEVETNRSDAVRLSMAFNFGPPDPP